MEYPYQQYQGAGGHGGYGAGIIPNQPSPGGSSCTVPITVAKLTPQFLGGGGGISWWLIIFIALLVIWLSFVTYDLYSSPANGDSETRYIQRIKGRTGGI